MLDIIKLLALPFYLPLTGVEQPYSINAMLYNKSVINECNHNLGTKAVKASLGVCLGYEKNDFR